MKILLTAQQGKTFDTHFPEHILSQLRAMGEVELNPFSRPFTREELKARLGDVDIVVSHWGTPQIDAELLSCAPRLKILAHAAGTVAHIASEAFYERGIPVLSANSVMAKYVAEGVLGYLIAGGHRMVQTDRIMRAGGWDKRGDEHYSLWHAEIGLIGLGEVARNLLDLIRPFDCDVCVYDPYLPENGLDRWPFAHRGTLDEVLSRPIVSVHAAQTPETYHMIDEGALAKLPDGATLINTSRGSLVDTKALIRELQKGRLYAVLDVYEHEGAGEVDPELLACTENTILQPHASCCAARWHMTQEIISDLGRFLHGEPLKLQVSLRQYRLMTQE